MCHQLHISIVLFYWFDSFGSIGMLHVWFCVAHGTTRRNDNLWIPASNLTSTFDHLYIKQFKSIVIWDTQKKTCQKCFPSRSPPFNSDFRHIWWTVCRFLWTVYSSWIEVCWIFLRLKSDTGKKVEEPSCLLYTNSIGKIINGRFIKDIFGLIRH